VKPARAADFTFVEASHTYSRGGIVFPSATRCIDHAGLTDYQNVREDILERRSEIGRNVHEAAHYYDEKDLNWDSISAETRGFVESWANWLAGSGFVVGVIEHQQIASLHGMRYGMKLDRFGVLRKKPTMVEIKITREIQDWHAVQLALYVAGFELDPDLSPLAKFLTTQRTVVQLRPAGKMAREVTFDDRKDYDVATWALGITHWKLNHDRKIRELGDNA